MLAFFNSGLSPRLQGVAAMVPEGKALADIGTDHAYLPIYLVGKGYSPRAVGVESRYGPYQNALSNVAAAGLSHRIDIRLGWGLKPLKPGEVQVITMAGLGCSTMRAILSASPEILNTVQHLILQPQGQEGDLRRWLGDTGWRLVDEDLIWDRGRYYVLLAWEPGSNPSFSWWEWEVGPLLVAKGHPLLAGYLTGRLQQLQRVREGLAQSRRPETVARRREIDEKIRALQEVMTCLPPAGKS
ncbi:class I SAM-dependent methyltransferase [Moorellaceae bacterium AZ2]